MTINNKLHWQPAGATSAAVSNAGGRLLAVYQWEAKRRHAFFHPLYSAGGNAPLTCFAPWDHCWHRGLWWSWKYINGVNFWEQMHDDGRGEGRSLVTAHCAAERGDGVIEITETVALQSFDSGATLVQEARRLLLLPALAAVPGAWAIEWNSTSTALVDCEFAATPYPETPWGGYAGLNFRPNRCLGWDEEICNSQGATGKEACHAMPARWAAYAGNLDGNEHDSAAAPARAGVAILDHPQNPRHPNAFYTWSVGADNRGFGFLALCPLLAGSLVLPAGASLSYRALVVMFDGAVPSDALDNAWQSWVEGDSHLRR